MLELRDVRYRYGGTDMPAVSGVSLRVAAGERVCLLGANGSGKSTVARLACGDLSPDRGSVLLDGRPLAMEGDAGAVALVGQDPRECLTSSRVSDEVSFAPRCLLLDETEVVRRRDEALRLCGIESLRARRVSELSGGQLQLVAIAAAIAAHPRFLVLDEAWAHLDAPSRERVHEVVGRLMSSGVGVLQVTHDARDLQGADRVLVMSDGTLVWEGTEAAWRSDAHAQAVAGGVDRASIGVVVPEPSQEAAPLALDAVSVSYGDRLVLDSLSLTARPGELVLLCGPSGSGKTTAALVLAGLTRPRAGRALLGHAEVRPGAVGLAFQRPEDQLFASSAWDDVAYGPRNLGLPEAEVRERVSSSLTALGVPEDSWHQHAQALSGGMRHRVALAAIVAMRPGAYVLDEPTAGLDGQGRALLHDLVRGLVRAGSPVLVITHDPAEWADGADDIVELCGDGGDASPNALVATLTAQGRTQDDDPGMGAIDVRVRLVGLLALTVALLACHGPVGMGMAIAAVALLVTCARVSPAGVVRAVLPVVPLLVAVTLANLLRVDGTGDVWILGAIGISAMGAWLAARAALRIVLLVSLGLVASAELSSADVGDAVGRLVRPFARWGVPVADVTMAVSVAVCLIPQAYDEVRRIERAQRARAAHLDGGSPPRRLRSWVAVLAPAVVVLFDRADALARSMRLRGYRGSMTTRQGRMGVRDWLVLGVTLCLAAVVAAC